MNPYGQPMRPHPYDRSVPLHQMGRQPNPRWNPPPPKPPERYLSAQEVAKMMNVSAMTIYRLCHEKKIHSIRVGRSIRIPESSVEEFVATQLDQ